MIRVPRRSLFCSLRNVPRVKDGLALAPFCFLILFDNGLAYACQSKLGNAFVTLNQSLSTDLSPKRRWLFGIAVQGLRANVDGSGSRRDC